MQIQEDEIPGPTREQVEAARRLWAHAHSDASTARHTGAFLLSLYDGSRYPVSLSSLRVLDGNLYRDCLAVLELHFHDYFYMYLNVFDEDYERLAKNVAAKTQEHFGLAGG